MPPRRPAPDRARGRKMENADRSAPAPAGARLRSSLVEDCSAEKRTPSRAATRISSGGEAAAKHSACTYGVEKNTRSQNASRREELKAWIRNTPAIFPALSGSDAATEKLTSVNAFPANRPAAASTTM